MHMTDQSFFSANVHVMIKIKTRKYMKDLHCSGIGLHENKVITEGMIDVNNQLIDN